MNTLESNKAVVRAFLRALGAGDVAGLRAVISEDIVAVCTGTSLLSTTRKHADVCAAAGMLGAVTQSGIDFRILALTAEADRVSCEAEGRSTLRNGTPYNNQYHFLFTLRDGKVVSMKEYLDTKLVDAALGPLVQAAG